MRQASCLFTGELPVTGLPSDSRTIQLSANFSSPEKCFKYLEIDLNRPIRPIYHKGEDSRPCWIQKPQRLSLQLTTGHRKEASLNVSLSLLFSALDYVRKSFAENNADASEGASSVPAEAALKNVRLSKISTPFESEFIHFRWRTFHWKVSSLIKLSKLA